MYNFVKGVYVQNVCLNKAMKLPIVYMYTTGAATKTFADERFRTEIANSTNFAYN